MGFCSVTTAAVSGLKVELVRVEADISSGLPGFHLVGYLSSEVKEASERVRTAIRNMNVSIPPRKITVNLSPAWVRKRGTAFDLPVAAALLGALGLFSPGRLEGVFLAGELGLDGRIHPVEGILPMVLEAKEQGFGTFLLPRENTREGALAEGAEILGASTLAEVADWLKTGKGLYREPNRSRKNPAHGTGTLDIDYSDIHGQEGVKRATLVAVAGNHSILYIGPPGSGKTMMARRIPTILPPPGREESMELTKIYSIMGLLQPEKPLITVRPFREVHHSVTRAALIGGGRIPVPGECTLAHGGVLFLDELPEFSRTVLESLRQPLEEKCVHLARNQGSCCFPADFMLAAAMNPCPCGYYPDYRICGCTDAQIQGYLGKISQPFLDRIDICAEAPRVSWQALGKSSEKEWSSAVMREKVEKAREIQKKRFRGRNIRTNSQMGEKELARWCRVGKDCREMMEQAYEQLGLTARSFQKILRVARTVADLEGSTEIEQVHLAEALGYRVTDKKYWSGR